MSDEMEKPDEEVDTWMEMNRSLSLFFSITRLLAAVAGAIIVAANPDPVYVILNIDENLSRQLLSIPVVFATMFVLIAVQIIFSSILGIWAFARLNRHLLTAYGFILILTLIWYIYVTFLVMYSRRENKYRKALYEDYIHSKKIRKTINVFQTMKKCCGIESYRFENVLPMPNSCCDSLPENTVCTPELSYKNVCNLNKMAIYDAIEQANVLNMMYYVAIFVLTSTVTEVTLAYLMVYRLSSEQMEDL